MRGQRSKISLFRFWGITFFFIFAFSYYPAGNILLPSAQAAANCGSSNVLCVGSGQEYTSITNALAAAGPGYTILVYPGSYGNLSVSQSGSSGNPITIESQTADGASLGSVDISGAYVTLDGFNVPGGVTVEGSANFVTVSDNEIDNMPNVGVFVNGCTTAVQDLSILNNDIGNGQHDGIDLWCNTNNITIEGNYIHDLQPGSDGDHVDVIQAYGSSGTSDSNVTIEDNRASNVEEGILFKDFPSSNLTIENNTLFTGGPWDIYIFQTTGVTVSHNTAGNINFDGTTKSITLQNNIANQVAVLNGSATFASRGYNLVGGYVGMSSASGDITGSPIFIGGSSPSTWAGYQLAGNSPGYKAGSDGLDMGTTYYGSGTVTPPPSDTTPPTISLSAPANNSIVSGSVTLSAAASDNVAVSSVTFKVDNVAVGTDTASPYTFSWNSASVANGMHTITATAVDSFGNQATSANVAVTVSNTVTPPSSTSSSISLVQKISSASTGAASVSVKLPSSVTAGNFIIVGLVGWSLPVNMAVTDSLGNTYASAGTMQQTGGTWSAIYYAANINGGTDKITVSNSTSSEQFSVVAAEFSGVATASPLDTSAGATGSGTSPSSGNMTPTASGDLLIGAGTHDLTTVTSAGSGFTMIGIATEDSNSHQPGAMDYEIIGNTNPVAATFSLAGSGPWAQSGALFKASSGGSASTPTSTPTSTSDTTAPSVPTNLSAKTISTSQINLSWNVSTDNVGVTGYKIYRNGVQVGTSTTVLYSDSGLSAGTTYSYAVSAYDAAGNVSAKSGSVSGTTSSTVQTSGILSTPTGLTAIPVSSSEIDLSWTASQNATGYNVFRNSTKIASVLTTSFNDTGLTSGTTYNYVVVATNSVLSSGNSISVSAQTQSTNTPSSNSGSGGSGTSSAPLTSSGGGGGGGGGSISVIPPVVATTTTATTTTTTPVTSANSSSSGSLGNIITTGWLNVRTSASVSGAKRGTVPPGIMGVVIQGPVSSDGYSWYEVQYANGMTGWSVGNYLDFQTDVAGTTVSGSSSTISNAQLETLIQALYAQLDKLLAQLAVLQGS